MRARDAKKIRKGDMVLVWIGPARGEDHWEHGVVTGEVREVDGRVLVPVVSNSLGRRVIDHSEVR